MKFNFYPLKNTTSKRSKKVPKRTYKRTRKSIGFKRILGVLKSFQVKEIFVNIDTGDFVLNAQLYPLCMFLNYHIGQFSINFEGKNQIKLQLRNRPIYLIKAIINP